MNDVWVWVGITYLLNVNKCIEGGDHVYLLLFC